MLCRVSVVHQETDPLQVSYIRIISKLTVRGNFQTLDIARLAVSPSSRLYVKLG